MCCRVSVGIFKVHPLPHLYESFGSARNPATDRFSQALPLPDEIHHFPIPPVPQTERCFWKILANFSVASALLETVSQRQPFGALIFLILCSCSGSLLYSMSSFHCLIKMMLQLQNLVVIPVTAFASSSSTIQTHSNLHWRDLAVSVSCEGFCLTNAHPILWMIYTHSPHMGKIKSWIFAAFWFNFSHICIVGT